MTDVLQAAQLQLALAKDYEAVFTSEPGQRVLADLHNQAFMNHPMVDTAAETPIDFGRLVLKEGRRSLVFYIRGRIAQARPDRLPQKTALTGPKVETDGT